MVVVVVVFESDDVLIGAVEDGGENVPSGWEYPDREGSGVGVCGSGDDAVLYFCGRGVHGMLRRAGQPRHHRYGRTWGYGPRVLRRRSDADDSKSFEKP